MKNAYSTYKTANVETADQGKLILIAYDIAIKNCRMALERFTPGSDPFDRNKCLYKAQDAITELMSSLRLDVGEVAQNLYKMNLVQGVVKNSASNVEETLKHLLSLREAWDTAILQSKVAAAGGTSEGPRSFAAKI